MDLIFERGDRNTPSGHALIYFTTSEGPTLATYVAVPPIPFDISEFVPNFLAGALEGVDMGNVMGAAPIPPIPQEVPDASYLRSLADRRNDDLVYAGGTMNEPMRLMAEASEAARLYAQLYEAAAPVEMTPSRPVVEDMDRARFADMTEAEQLAELNSLTGRLRVSVESGAPDEEVEREMRALQDVLPAKYRVGNLIAAAVTPGPRGQRLAELHLQRIFKLFHEEYLELERIDREIEAASRES